MDLGMAGFIVGVMGVGLSILSYMKMQTARQAEKEIERKFMHYMAAQEFDELALAAVVIVGKLRRREWEDVADLAHKVGSSFGQARGARSRLLAPLERDKLDGAGIGLQRFIASLPVGANPADVPIEQMQTMISQCQMLVGIASELAGRLRVESILRPEEKE